MEYNYIKKLPPELFTLSKLEYLELDYNLIKDLPDELANIKNLKQISLYGNSTIFKNHKIVENIELKMPSCEFLTSDNYLKNKDNKK
ncbi:leucine-rich repeat domain-containing protein [Mesonia aquimarina]|uniref:leucine-rich repeat domain-containing protein n=1 Tax=Mesonia aquimarina TaxID=1504967 RepID=UPI0013CEE253|nr:leucine-rich repeat domain-containing protein [Mesonia aquimarina]